MARGRFIMRMEMNPNPDFLSTTWKTASGATILKMVNLKRKGTFNPDWRSASGDTFTKMDP